MKPLTPVHYLRRTPAPYFGQIVIFSLATIGAVFVSLKNHDLGIALAVPVMWLLFLPLLYFGLKYKIFWTENEVVQIASGGLNISIQYAKIEKISLEISKSGELFSAARPLRRIAIYANVSSGERKFIDISLKHFAEIDIRQLMLVIHEHRPDLTLPESWIQKK